MNFPPSHYKMRICNLPYQRDDFYKELMHLLPSDYLTQGQMSKGEAGIIHAFHLSDISTCFLLCFSQINMILSKEIKGYIIQLTAVSGCGSLTSSDYSRD